MTSSPTSTATTVDLTCFLTLHQALLDSAPHLRSTREDAIHTDPSCVALPAGAHPVLEATRLNWTYCALCSAHYDRFATCSRLAALSLQDLGEVCFDPDAAPCEVVTVHSRRAADAAAALRAASCPPGMDPQPLLDALERAMDELRLGPPGPPAALVWRAGFAATNAASRVSAHTQLQLGISPTLVSSRAGSVHLVTQALLERILDHDPLEVTGDALQVVDVPPGFSDVAQRVLAATYQHDHPLATQVAAAIAATT